MESRLGVWLNTNHVPTQDEVVMLNQELAGPSRKIHRLEEEITKLQDALFEVKKERGELEQYYSAHSALVSPVRRLLPDILREIFYHCLPTGRNPVMSRREAPILLGRICRQWRDIVLTTPRLWASLHISVPSNDTFTALHTCSHAVRTQAITEWLSHSGACPLSISFHIPFPTNLERHHSEVNIPQLYLDTISSFVPRCKSLYLTAYQTHIWAPFLAKYNAGNFPLLEHLYFDGSGLGEGDSTSAMRESGILKGPRLRSLTLIVYPGSEALRLPVRWEHLAELHLSATEVNWEPSKAFAAADALTLLSLCPGLEFCSIALSDMAVSPNPPGSRALLRVSLPNLTGLSIQSDTDPRPFFIYLFAPALRYLQYHQEPPSSADIQLDGSEKTLHRALEPFIENVIHPIEELQFCVTYLTAVDVIKCLELFPELRRLSLHGAGSLSFDHVSFPPPGDVDLINRLSVGDVLLHRLTPNAPLKDFASGSDNGDTSDGENSISHLDSDDEGFNNQLCPKLEAFHCSGAAFADATMLRFLHARSSHEQPGASRLKWASICFPFGRTATPGILEKLDNLRNETDMFISTSYSTFDGRSFGYSGRKYSPYDGLEIAALDENGYYPYNPEFGPLTTPSQ